MAKPKVSFGEIKCVENTNRYRSANRHYYAVLLKDKEDPCQAFLFTAQELNNAQARANKNREDVPAHSWFKELKDVV